MKTRLVVTLILASSPPIVGCSPPRAEDRSVASAPGGDTSSDAGLGSLFAWKLDVTSPSFERHSAPLRGLAGDIDLGFDRWQCAYTIDPNSGFIGRRDESAWVTCTLRSTGAKVETMVLCRETEHRPSDCGNGSLRVTNDSGQLYAMSMSCKSEGNDCWERPRIVEDSAASSAPSASSASAAGRTATSNAGKAPSTADVAAPPARLRDKDGSLHFHWGFDVSGGARPSRSFAPQDSGGEIVTDLDGWSCAYSIAAQEEAAYPHVEIGHATCTSKRTGDKAEGTLVCAENRRDPIACTMGSLAVTDETGQPRTVLMKCKGATDGCWK